MLVPRRVSFSSMDHKSQVPASDPPIRFHPSFWEDQNTIEQLMHQKFEIEQEYQAVSARKNGQKKHTQKKQQVSGVFFSSGGSKSPKRYLGWSNMKPEELFAFYFKS